MTIDFLLIFFIARYLRASLKTKENAPAWDEKLKWAMYISLGLSIAAFLLHKYEIALVIIGQAALIGLVYVLYKESVFKNARPILIAVAPYIICSVFTNLVKLLMPELYKSWQTVLDNISLFTVLWGIGVWLLTIKQKKELDVVKERMIEEEKNNKIMTAMKAELEVQVAERTAELRKQKEELENTLNELKATQAQLIHSEKMASLGELTAGIAHEIQNPLNFVNNFSEVSNELLDEMKEELIKGNREDAITIAEDVKQNLQKINHHGKRADAIVKGMLQHSRSSSGAKDLTDINALADEYLRLAYHGLRAKDKTFNAKFITAFDESLEKINIVPQEIGRVILNLINNAFYAVTEKKKLALANYEPTVTVSTRKMDDAVQIKVSDNGNGIPQNIIDKIFQPFFTTKPTGEGTGLGLSLSYDIITKGHGGELKVETKENEGTTFIILLPYETTTP